MKTFGDRLREAREERGVTTSEAAAATRIKIQIIEDLEKNRLHRTYAPVYAKGFIRIYSEYLGLDTASLLSTYESQRHTETEEPLSIRNTPAPASSTAAPREKEPALWQSRFREILRSGWQDIVQRIRRISQATWRKRLLDRIRAGLPSSAKDAAKQTPENEIEPTDGGGRRPWHERVHHAIRGPYRLHAAVIVTTVLLLILIIIIGAAIRRQPQPVVDPEETPSPGMVPGDALKEFTHEPPPPYYR